MATAKSVTFEAGKDCLFADAIQIIQSAGYIISETDDAARKVVYYADSKGFMNYGRYETTITIAGASGFSAETALFSMKVVGVPDSGHVPNNPQFEGEVIDYVINKLSKLYPLVRTASASSDAPGAGGKAGCLVLLGLLAAGSGFGSLMLLAALLS